MESKETTPINPPTKSLETAMMIAACFTNKPLISLTLMLCLCGYGRQQNNASPDGEKEGKVESSTIYIGEDAVLSGEKYLYNSKVVSGAESRKREPVKLIKRKKKIVLQVKKQEHKRIIKDYKSKYSANKLSDLSFRISAKQVCIARLSNDFPFAITNPRYDFLQTIISHGSASWLYEDQNGEKTSEGAFMIRPPPLLNLFQNTAQ